MNTTEIILEIFTWFTCEARALLKQSNRMWPWSRLEDLAEKGFHTLTDDFFQTVCNDIKELLNDP